jgi:two-component system response regulator YesN
MEPTMPYKVFLVEDEIVAREGMRDSVAWKTAGFELCGEAPDGEIALPLIEAAQPDVLITDIMMPFMDGLQLCKIIREHMPWTKIIIISGYDEFSYAQTAVKLGVTEYLLKPVSVDDLLTALARVASLLDQERSERESLKQLRSQAHENLMAKRERFLLRLVLGGESSVTAVEQSQLLGLDLISRCYLVIQAKICPAVSPGTGELAGALDFHDCQQVETLVKGLVEANLDTFLTKKDLEELVLILKGENPEALQQDGQYLAALIKQEVESKVPCRLDIGLGEPQSRLGDLHRSYTGALLHTGEAWNGFNSRELRRLDPAVVTAYLESGMVEAFEPFFDAYIRPLMAAALHSPPYKHYLLLDIILSAAQYVSDLGGKTDEVLPEILSIAGILEKTKSIDLIKDETARIFHRALAFRDSLKTDNRQAVIQQAKAYLEAHSANPDLSLHEIAAYVNFSPSYFSSVFSREVGETFKDYLTRIRLEKAKKLLRTTDLKCYQVAYACGYNDPHYFSVIFRKYTGLTPQKYRK